MRTDNTANLITAARRRHELTRSKTIEALHELDELGITVTYQVVARRAQVSRSWLYTQPDIRAEIERLRDHGRKPPPTSTIPTRQRTTEPSLQRRLETAIARIRELTAEKPQNAQAARTGTRATTSKQPPWASATADRTRA